jgi:hypothetical protein
MGKNECPAKKCKAHPLFRAAAPSLKKPEITCILGLPLHPKRRRDYPEPDHSDCHHQQRHHGEPEIKSYFNAWYYKNLHELKILVLEHGR